ncbi:MAG: zf-TFIIB domain-containing protein [Bacteroidota bacterium]
MTSNRNCPRCEVALQLQYINERGGNIEVDQCPDCQGIWFDKGELDALEKVVEPVLVEFRKIPNEYDQLTGLWCPNCQPQQMMDKHRHERDEQVIIDQCPQCEGVWLDSGELEAIQKENWVAALFGFFDKFRA